MITQSRLKALLEYDPATGAFYARGTRIGSHHKRGDKIGTPTQYGKTQYVRIRLNHRVYYAHRLAWLYMYGEWPKLIDHINGDGADNRLANLRLTTHSNNHGNSTLRADNKTGFKGVTRTQWNTFRAAISKDGRQYELGIFKTPEAAHAAYIKKAKQLFGKFAHSGFICLALVMLSNQAKTECLTHEQARLRWPHAHLRWHTEDHCWDDSRTYKHEAPPPAPPKVPIGIHDGTPLVLSGSPVIIFPALIKAGPPDAALLAPESAVAWPLLYDVDDMRPRFIVWEQRISGQF